MHISAPITAAKSVRSQELKIAVEVTEANGFDADPGSVTLKAREFLPPDIQLVDQGVDDANENGVIDLGETVDVTARIRNVGPGRARDVTVAIEVRNEGENIFFHGSARTIDIGELKPGESRDLKFGVTTNKRYTGTSLPIRIAVNEQDPKYRRAFDLSLPLSKPVRRIVDLVVEGREPGGSAPATEAPLTIDVDNDIPAGSTTNPDAVGLVIGISRYQNREVPGVTFGRRDATVMREYLVRTLGYDPRRIVEMYDEEASLAGFKRVFEEQLSNYVRAGRSDVFVYYSGHGVPDPETKEAFVVPYDCNPSYARSTGFRLKDVYELLSRLRARTVTVVMDACFSGASENGALLKNISPLTISVESPAFELNNGVVFASSTGQQVSSWFPEKKHGLFTYYFLKGLQGSADLNRDRSLTVGEMEEYLLKHVPDEALLLNNRKQTPQVLGSDRNRILVTLK